MPVIVDQAAAALADFVCGANEKDAHLTGVNWGRDLPEPQVADLRNVVNGDPSPAGSGTLSIRRGIEVGHIFQLGRKYSEAMKATVLDPAGQNLAPWMGCYGIGVTRIVAAAIEQNHDEKGIRLAGAHRALHRHAADPQPRSFRSRAPGCGHACMPNWRPPASTCCMTTAMRDRA